MRAAHRNGGCEKIPLVGLLDGWCGFAVVDLSSIITITVVVVEQVCTVCFAMPSLTLIGDSETITVL